MTVEEIVRMAITAAYLEGGNWAYVAKRDGRELTMADVNVACDDYVARSIRGIMAALAEDDTDA